MNDMADQSPKKQPGDLDPNVAKRNKALGLALGAFVIILMIVSYFRMSALSP